MSRLGISTGTTPNDGTGDSLLSGATKINSNFDELYNLLGDGTTLSGIVTSLTAGDNISLSGSTGNVTITGQASGANVTISDNPPSSPNSGDLWWESDAGRLKVYYSNVWVDSNPAGGNSGGGGGGGISGINIQDEGSVLSTTATALNFVGNGVVASGTGATKTITVSGGGSGIDVQDEGSALSTTATTLNFVGGGVVASGTGATKTITISGGGSGVGTENVRTDSLVVSGVTTCTGGIIVPNNQPVTIGDITIENRTSPATGSLIETGSDLLLSQTRLLVNNQPNDANMIIATQDASVELYYDGSKKLETSGVGVTITGSKSFFTSAESNNPATLQIETGSAGVGASIRSSSSLELVTNGSAFSVNLDNTSAILAGGTGVSQYVSLYGQGSEKLITTPAGVRVGAGLNLQYQNNASTILHNSTLGQFNIQSVSGVNIKPGPSHFSVYSSDDVLRFKVIPDGGNIYGNLNVGLATVVGAATSNNTVNTPALTLSHNNPTVVSTAGTTGQFKQIGGQPYYYDGTTWRALFLSEAPLTVNQADSDWDNTMIRMNFDQANIGAVTNLKDGRTPSVGLVDVVSSPVKYGTKSARFQANNSGINFTQDNSGSVYYPFEGAWTLEGWFYFNSSALPSNTNISNSPVLFANYHPNTSTSYNWKIGYYRGSGVGGDYNFYWYNRNSSATGSGQAGNSGTGFLLAQLGEAQFADNAWHHFAIVREPGNGSIHFYFDGYEQTKTSSDQLIDNEIYDTAGHYFNIGHYGQQGQAGQFDGNIDDVRISKSARYTTNFTPPASALPITGSTTTVYEPADSKVGEISLGSSPVWTGTPGVTASQVAAGQYRATFATPYSNVTDYVIQTSMNDYTPATTPISIGVSRFTTHADFFIRRVSDGANIDTGSLAIDLFKK
jgi:hypothetical protein